MNTICFTSILTLSFIVPVIAENRIKDHKPTIAVLDFTTHNCPASLGSVTGDILAGKLFQTGQFMVLERSQINLVRSRQATPLNMLDIEAIAGLGTLLQADIIIAGSVSKLDNYIIEIRVINVKTKKVELSLSQEASSAGKLKNEMVPVKTKIDNYYKGYPEISGDYDLAVAPVLIYPVGELSKAAKTGFGVNYSLVIHEPWYRNIDLMLQCGFYYMTPAMDSIEYLYMVPLTINVLYNLPLTEHVTCVPSFGIGYLFSISSYDEVEKRASGEYQYRTEIFYNPLITVRCEFNFRISPCYRFAVIPRFSAFLEEGPPRMMPGLDVGFRILF